MSAQILPFPRRSPQPKTRLFFARPPELRMVRVKEMARAKVPLELISTVCSMPVEQITAILKVRP